MQSKEIERWCAEVTQAFSSLKWQNHPCEKINWKTGGTSVRGRPLVYVEFGDSNSDNTTLIFSTVHGDEITPLYIGMDLVEWVKERESKLLKSKVVIAPLVNPDGFYSAPRTRMNANGVDLNRNLPTRDSKRGITIWKTRFRSDRRRFPGNVAGSEPETAFQEELIRKFHPQKILSVHSPLNFLDYDGPSSISLSRFPTQYAK